jgi:O-antigen ligase
MFHIASRAAMAALVSGLFFWACANLWIRSRQVALLSFVTIVVVGIITLGAFYRYAVQDKAIDARAPDAISRTIREIQSQDPGFRLPIWQRTLSRIAAQPDHLLFGRGIGSFPIDEGAGAPDWLLRKTEGAWHHPHNIHLDLLYETGLVGMLLFGALTLFPLVASCGYWSQFSSTERSAIAIYVFSLVGVELSGSFAFDYGFQFFLALAIGTVVLKRKKLAEAGGLPSTYPCEASA